MKQIAQGGFSIRKIVDGKTLTFTLSTNLGTSQIVTRDSAAFNPDYTKTPLVLTPTLSVSGSTGNQITSAPVYTINGGAVTGFGTVGTTAPFALTINKNMTTIVSMVVKATYTYIDPVSKATSPVSTEISINKVENGGMAIMAVVYASPTDTFSTIGDAIQEIQVNARMVRGADDDYTDIGYLWQISNGGEFFTITNAQAPAGSGLPAGDLFSWNKATLALSNILTVKSTAVLNIATVSCKMTDTDSPANSNTSGKSVTGFVTLRDITDPYDIIARQPQGDSVLVTSTVPTIFEVWQGGAILPDSFFIDKTLSFFRYTAAGVIDKTWVPSPAFTGWTVATGEVSRTYATATPGTAANRTVTMANGHLLTTQATTTFGINLEA